MDDLPIGGGNTGGPSEFPPEESSAPKSNPDADKPLDQRLVSKTWSIRKDAFDELKNAFKKLPENSSKGQMMEHSSNWAKYLPDPHPGALENVLDCFNEFIVKCDPGLLSSIQVGIIKPMVDKCLGQAKANLKAKSLECMILIFEVSENFEEETMDAIIAVMKAPKPKDQQTATYLLANLMQAYGPKRFKPAKFSKAIESMANSSTPAMRTEAMNCYKALFQWVGEAGVGAFIEPLKTQQKEQLTKDFEEIKAAKKEFKRKTRSEKEKAKEAALDEAIAAEEAEEVPDVFDMAAEINILSKFNTEWLASLSELKKWNEKSDKLTEVQTEANTPKLAPGDYSALFDALKKLAGDAHATVSSNAIKAIGALAKGLRADFKEHAKQASPLLFQKFKEKKLVPVINECFENFMMCLELGDLIEIVVAEFKSEKPKAIFAVKQNILIFLEKVITTTNIDMLEDIKGQLATTVMNGIEEKDPGVRDQGVKVLGIMVARLGDSVMAKQTDSLKPTQLAKLNETKEAYKPSKYDKSARKEAAKAKAAANAPVKKAPAKAVAKKPVANDNMEEKKDELMDFDMGGTMDAPKKQPPKLGQKPVVKKKEPEEEKKVPGSRPPAAKPAMTSGGTIKTVKADDIKEEDVGEGLSKDQAIEKVNEFYDSEHISKFEDAKWQVKVEGFTGLKQQIEELKPDSVMVEATCKFIKIRMKDWKESNLNMMKEAIFTLQTITANCERIPKRAIIVYTPFLCEKLGDIKMMGPVKEVLLELSSFVSAKFISVQVVKKGLGTKAPNNIKESANFLASLIDEFGAAKVAVKECIDFAVFCANHANPAVRTASMNLFAVIYKHLGEAVRTFLSDIKPSTMQLIEAEFQKVTPLKKGEYQSSREAKGDLADEPEANEDAAASLDAALPREDISKQLNAKLLKLFEDKEWKNKIKGADTVNGILKDAKMRIQPDGIGDLMEILKKNLKEANKAVLKSTILLLGTMAEVVGQPILRYMKKCLVPMMHILSDKATLLRADVVNSINKWSEVIGPEPIINHLSLGLEAGNPEYRDESLKWITTNKDAIQKCDQGAMVKPLIACLTDKKGENRKMAEEIIIVVMGFTGFGKFQDGVQDLKTAVQQTVRPIIERAKGKAVASSPRGGQDESMEEVKKPALTKKAGTARAPPPKGPTLKPQHALPQEFEKEPSPHKSPKNSFAERAKMSKPKAAVSARQAQPQEEEFYCNPGNKEKRAQLYGKSKWMHEELKPDQVDKVKTYCEQIFGMETAKLMNQNDFKKHVQVLGKLVGMIETQPENLIEVIDIIFKWIYIKLVESSNTTFTSCVCDSLAQLFNWLISEQYQFLEHEAFVVVPMLCERSGINNAILKNKIKALIKQSFEMYDHRKNLGLIIKFGCGSKSLKSVAESLNEVSIFVKANGVECLSEKDLKMIAKLADNSDTGVREGSLTVLGEAYRVLDDDIWRVIGNVTLKVKGLLEQRFKKLKPGLNSSATGADLKFQGPGRNVSPHSNKPPQTGMNRSFAPASSSTPNLKFQSNKQLQEGNASSGNLTKSFKAHQTQNKFTSSINSNKSGNQIGQYNQGRPANQTIQPQKPKRFSPARQTENQHNQRSFQNEIQGGRGQTEPVNFYGNNNRKEQMMIDDDDEDLRQQLADMETSQAPAQPKLDPETQRQVEEIMKHIQNLKYSSELSKRVESLIALNEIIQAVQQHEQACKKTANDLICAFTHVLIDIFERPIKDFPLRFAKYFVTIVNKTCSCREIMEEVREQEIYEMSEQLLTRLLIDNLDKLGQDKEGEFILKNLNASMLRCLENCNKTSIFCVLFNLLRRYKDQTMQPKLPGLIIKCLLKLSKILEKVINELEIERVLICIHLYLISIDHEKKSNNDDMGIRIVKTLVHEMVKIKQHSILESYKIVQNHEVEDKHLSRWIKIILNSFEQNPPPIQNERPADGSGSQANIQQNTLDKEISTILDCLKNTETFDSGIQKLYTFLAKNPQLSLDYYLRDLSGHFSTMIKTNLETYRVSLSETGSTPMSSKVKMNNWTAQSPAPEQQSVSKFGRQNSALTPDQQAPRFGQQQQEPASAGLTGIRKLGQRPATAIGAGSTGGLNKPDLDSSSDRLNQYQNKLSDMRQKFQARKSAVGESDGTPQNEPSGQTSEQKPPTTSKFGGLQKHNSAQVKSGEKQNLNTSFSAMNSSLQQKWSALKNTKNASARGDNMSSTMIGMQGRATGNPTELQAAKEPLQGAATGQANLTKSQNAQLVARTSGAGGESGATSQDLNRRLAEMKAKLQALKK